MSAGHFFVGLGAGIAILAVPVLTLTPGRELPQRLVAWIDGPPPREAQVSADDAAVTRPLRGYRAGDPTPGADAPTPPPTLSPSDRPTPSSVPTEVVSAPSAQVGGSGIKTGVIRSDGAPVAVRRVAGVDGGDDPLIPDGSPVLVSSGAGVQAVGQQWRAIRALGGISGWVLSSQLVVDGEAAQAPRQPVQVAAGVPSPTPGDQRATIANTDGAGVVLRNSPNEADRTTRGLMDGAGVTVLERAGADWAHVRSDNGLQGWIPARYLAH